LVSNIRTYDDSYDPSNQAIVTIFIRYDQRFIMYNRRVYSIMELLGDVGGLQQALYLIGLLVVSYFTRRLFVSQLLRELY